MAKRKKNSGSNQKENQAGPSVAKKAIKKSKTQTKEHEQRDVFAEQPIQNNIIKAAGDLDKKALAAGKKSSKKHLSGRLTRKSKKKTAEAEAATQLSFEDETDSEEVEIAKNYLRMQLLTEVQN